MRWNKRKTPRTFDDLIVDALLAGDDNVEPFGRGLKALRARLDAPVAVQHVQQTVARVQFAVFAFQILVDVVVGGAELVAVGSVGRGAGQFHLVAGSVRVHPVALLAEEVVGLHAAVHVAGTDDGDLQLRRHGRRRRRRRGGRFSRRKRGLEQISTRARAALVLTSCVSSSRFRVGAGRPPDGGHDGHLSPKSAREKVRAAFCNNDLY